MARIAEVLGALQADEVEAESCQCGEFPSAKTFLQSRPAGVYSCARAKASETASGLETVVEWSFHLQRLATGLAVVDANFNQDKLKLDKLKVATEVLAATVVADWQAAETEDGMLSVLWYPLADSEDYAVAVHICAMPTPKCLASTVLVYGEGREKARCKHSKWIQDRVPIEKHVQKLVETRGEPIHEVLLSKAAPGGDRLLLEGLITNFFVGTSCYQDGSEIVEKLTLCFSNGL
ncbi:unnamed protein product [Phytophthora lilii]|uniref:Unnamed protein product n=1 Tax=Phytophthora lilii TaxID=2077276 RepID=A0A9W6TEK3_9STRA|nr:unnamed protein product [Phytophthora lilii]